MLKFITNLFGGKKHETPKAPTPYKVEAPVTEKPAPKVKKPAVKKPAAKTKPVRKPRAPK